MLFFGPVEETAAIEAVAGGTPRSISSERSRPVRSRTASTRRTPARGSGCCSNATAPAIASEPAPLFGYLLRAQSSFARRGTVELSVAGSICQHPRTSKHAALHHARVHDELVPTRAVGRQKTRIGARL